MNTVIRIRSCLMGAVLLAATGLSLTSLAQNEAQLAIQTCAGLTITGEIGEVYSVEYVNELGRGEDWKCLEFVQLLESPQLWMDKSAPVRGGRYYRAVQMDAPTNMVWIPPGTFRMGSTNDVGDLRRLEGPQTEVVVPRGFWMSKYEVTQGEWDAMMDYSLPNDNSGDPTLPVDYAQGDDAIAFCVAMTARQQEAGEIPYGCSFRLPTEIEWEYACRAQTSTRFSFGDDPAYTDITDYAWYEGNAGVSHQVGLKLANAWGLFDMHGNVAEWCYRAWAGADFLFSSYPGGRVIAPDWLSVVLTPRGGAWSDTDLCRAAARDVDRDYGFGFRVVLASDAFRPQPISNMVYIPPGTFLMGSPENEQDRQDNEGPQTRVTLTQGFWMGKCEVTQGEYQAVMGENPSWFNGVRSVWVESCQCVTDVDLTDAARPVDSVNWDDAVAYCEALSDQERAAGRIPRDYAYRLPTEAEWEYACRAGTSTRYSHGDDPDYFLLDDYAWHGGNSDRRTHPVGQKLPNFWGLYDMHGNVFEWPLDPNEREPGRWWPFGFVRGGGYVHYPSECRSASRVDYDWANGQEETPPEMFGFRVVLARVR